MRTFLGQVSPSQASFNLCLWSPLFQTPIEHKYRSISLCIVSQIYSTYINSYTTSYLVWYCFTWVLSLQTENWNSKLKILACFATVPSTVTATQMTDVFF
jgi:hypothetical protein